MAACVTQQNPDPSFTLSLSAVDGNLTLVQGEKKNITLHIERHGGFSEAVSLSLEKKGGGGLPSGVSYGFDPSVASGSNSTLSLEVSSGAPVGSYDLQIKGSASSKTQYAYLSLTVQEKPQPGSFSLTVNPSSRSLELPTSGSVTTTTEVGIVRNNFTDAVSLSLESSDGSALPAGISASFSPASSTADKSTLTLSVASTVQAKYLQPAGQGHRGRHQQIRPFHPHPHRSALTTAVRSRQRHAAAQLPVATEQPRRRPTRGGSHVLPPPPVQERREHPR